MVKAPTPPEWVTVQDAADMLDVSARTVRRYIKKHNWESKLDSLPGSDVNRRFIKAEDVREYARRSVTPAPSRDGSPAPLPGRLDVEPFRQDVQELTAALQDVAQELQRSRRTPVTVWIVAAVVLAALVGVVAYAHVVLSSL